LITQQIMRDRIQHQLQAAGVTVNAIGAGAIQLKGRHGTTVLTTDVLHLRSNELLKLTGGAAWQ
jgi:hypothetical protein